MVGKERARTIRIPDYIGCIEQADQPRVFSFIANGAFGAKRDAFEVRTECRTALACPRYRRSCCQRRRCSVPAEFDLGAWTGTRRHDDFAESLSVADNRVTDGISGQIVNEFAIDHLQFVAAVAFVASLGEEFQ